MLTAALSTSDTLYQSSTSDKLSQKKQYSQSLATNLESGNLSGAQTAFAQILKLNQNSSETGSIQTSSTISKDFQELEAALKSGDLTSSKNAFATLQRDTESLDSSFSNSLKPSNLSTAQQAYASQEMYLKLIASTNNYRNNLEQNSSYSTLYGADNVTFSGSA